MVSRPRGREPNLREPPNVKKKIQIKKNVLENNKIDVHKEDAKRGSHRASNALGKTPPRATPGVNRCVPAFSPATRASPGATSRFAAAPPSPAATASSTLARSPSATPTAGHTSTIPTALTSIPTSTAPITTCSSNPASATTTPKRAYSTPAPATTLPASAISKRAPTIPATSATIPATIATIPATTATIPKRFVPASASATPRRVSTSPTTAASSKGKDAASAVKFTTQETAVYSPITGANLITTSSQYLWQEALRNPHSDAFLHPPAPKLKYMNRSWLIEHPDTEGDEYLLRIPIRKEEGMNESWSSSLPILAINKQIYSSPNVNQLKELDQAIKSQSSLRYHDARMPVKGRRSISRNKPSSINILNSSRSKPTHADIPIRGCLKIQGHPRNSSGDTYLPQRVHFQTAMARCMDSQNLSSPESNVQQANPSVYVTIVQGNKARSPTLGPTEGSKNTVKFGSVANSISMKTKCSGGESQPNLTEAMFRRIDIAKIRQTLSMRKMRERSASSLESNYETISSVSNGELNNRSQKSLIASPNDGKTIISKVVPRDAKMKKSKPIISYAVDSQNDSNTIVFSTDKVSNPDIACSLKVENTPGPKSIEKDKIKLTGIIDSRRYVNRGNCGLEDPGIAVVQKEEKSPQKKKRRKGSNREKVSSETTGDLKSKSLDTRSGKSLSQHYLRAGKSKTTLTKFTNKDKRKMNIGVLSCMNIPHPSYTGPERYSKPVQRNTFGNSGKIRAMRSNKIHEVKVSNSINSHRLGASMDTLADLGNLPSSYLHTWAVSPKDTINKITKKEPWPKLAKKETPPKPRKVMNRNSLKSIHMKGPRIERPRILPNTKSDNKQKPNKLIKKGYSSKFVKKDTPIKSFSKIINNKGLNRERKSASRTKTREPLSRSNRPRSIEGGDKEYDKIMDSLMKSIWPQKSVNKSKITRTSNKRDIHTNKSTPQMRTTTETQSKNDKAKGNRFSKLLDTSKAHGSNKRPNKGNTGKNQIVTNTKGRSNNTKKKIAPTTTPKTSNAHRADRNLEGIKSSKISNQRNGGKSKKGASFVNSPRSKNRIDISPIPRPETYTEQLKNKTNEDTKPKEQLKNKTNEDTKPKEQLKNKTNEDTKPTEQLKNKANVDKKPKEQPKNKTNEDTKPSSTTVVGHQFSPTEAKPPKGNNKPKRNILVETKVNSTSVNQQGDPITTKSSQAIGYIGTVPKSNRMSTHAIDERLNTPSSTQSHRLQRSSIFDTATCENLRLQKSTKEFEWCLGDISSKEKFFEETENEFDHTSYYETESDETDEGIPEINSVYGESTEVSSGTPSKTNAKVASGHSLKKHRQSRKRLLSRSTSRKWQSTIHARKTQNIMDSQVTILYSKETFDPTKTEYTEKKESHNDLESKIEDISSEVEKRLSHPLYDVSTGKYRAPNNTAQRAEEREYSKKVSIIKEIQRKRESNKLEDSVSSSKSKSARTSSHEVTGNTANIRTPWK